MKPALDLAFTTLASSRPKAISTAIMLSGSRPQDADATFFLGKKLPAIAREGSSIDFTTTLSALGIGAGHDAALLSKIATAGHGSYVNIASPVLVSEQLGRLLSASRRTVVAGMHLVFEGCAPCELLEVEPGYGVSAHECSSTRQSSYFRTQKVMCLEVGALSAGQTRTVLFKLGLPGGDMVNKMAVNTPLARFLSCYSAGADKKGNGLLHLHHHTFRVMDVPRLTCKKPLQDGVPVRVNVTGDAATLEVSVVRQNIASCLASLMQNDGLGPALSAQEVEQMKGYFSVDGVTQNTDAMDRVMHRMQREEQLEDMKLKATSEWEVKVKGERKERAAAKRKKEKEAAAAAEAAATAAAAEGAAAAAPPADGAGAGAGEGDAAAADADAATADGGDAATAAAPAAVEEEEEEEVVVDEGAPEVTIPPPGIVSIDLRYTSPDPNKCHRMLVAIQKAFSTGVLQEQVNAALKEQAEREAEVARKALEALYNSPDEKAKREVEAAALAEEEAKAKAEAEALALAEEAAAVELARAIAAGEVEAPAPVEPVPVPEEEGGEAVKVPPVPPPPTIVNEGYRELVHYTIPGVQCVNRLAQVAMCEALATGDDTRFQSTLTLPDFARCDPNRDAASATLAQRQIGMYMCSSSAGEGGKYAAIMSEQQQQQAQCASEWPSVSYTSCHTLPLPPSRYLTSESRRTGELLGNYQWAREQVPCRMLPVTATAASDACVQLAWGVPVPDSNVQGTAVTHYTLRAVKAGGEIHGKAVLERVYEAPRSRCCIDQLTGGTYYFTVCAGNGKWDGAMSDVSTCVVIGTKEENNKNNNNQEEEKREKVTEFIKVSTVDREWKWYPAMSMWEQLPAVNENNPEEEGMWPPQVTVAETIQQQVPLAVEIAASPSGNGSIEVMWNAKYRSGSGSGSGEDDDGTGTGTGRYGEGEVTGGCAPHKTYHVAVVCAATGKQITKVYDSSVSDCCVQGLGGSDGSDGSNGNYHVAVWASNGFSMGLLSKPILVRLKGRKVPSSADNTFEFKIGGVLFRRPADI
jgi:chemotaxis protein histidine kinase CheA